MAETFLKKEKEKKRAKKKLEKAEKKSERKTHNSKGKSLDDMIAYVDEYGNITDVPPDKQKRTEINAADIDITQGGESQSDRDIESTGVVSLFFEDKGYGFITEDKTRVNIFVHSNKLMEAVKEKDKVSFKKEMTPKGISAIEVKKIK